MSRPDAAALARLADSLGHTFKDIALLELALTHASFHNGRRKLKSYQRLEFLGDRVLALVVAETLVREQPAALEGDLSRLLNQLVREETCAAVARELGLGRYLILGAGESKEGAAQRAPILADIAESVIGAIFLDGGWEAARDFVLRAWAPHMKAACDGPADLRDAKTKLQETVQAAGLPLPAYMLLDRSGPDHLPEFRVAVSVEGVGQAEGRAASKRQAERQAAEAMLDQLPPDLRAKRKS